MIAGRAIIDVRHASVGTSTRNTVRSSSRLLPPITAGDGSTHQSGTAVEPDLLTGHES